MSRAFPNGRRIQISSGGGVEPRWRKDGGELSFLSADRRLMAVTIPVGAGFQPGKPVALFPVRKPPSSAFRRNYDVMPDGPRFLVITEEENQAAPAITVVVNWPALVRSR